MRPESHSIVTVEINLVPVEKLKRQISNAPDKKAVRLKSYIIYEMNEVFRCWANPLGFAC